MRWGVKADGTGASRGQLLKGLVGLHEGCEGPGELQEDFGQRWDVTT